MDEGSPTLVAAPQRRLRRVASVLALALVLAAAAYVGWRSSGRERVVPRESPRVPGPAADAPRVRAPASSASIDDEPDATSRPGKPREF